MAVPDHKNLIIDGGNIFIASYEVGTAQGLKNSQGVPTGGVFVFLRTLRSLCNKFKPNSIYICWDSHPTWRHKVRPDYKGGREFDETVHSLRTQQRDFLKEKVLPHLPVTQARSPEWEADDIAGYLKGLLVGQNIFISNDFDWLQLVDDNDFIYQPKFKKKVTGKNFFDVTGLKRPYDYVRFKALTGDESDNLPRCSDFTAKYHGTVKSYLNGDDEELSSISEEYIREAMESKEYFENLMLMELTVSQALRPKFEGGRDVTSGILDKEKFLKPMTLLEIKSIINKYDDWISVFP